MTQDDDDTGEPQKPATDEFAQLAASLMGDQAPQQKPGMDPMMLMMFKMEQDRAAREREDRANFWNKIMALAPLAVPLIERLFGAKGPDPILMKLLETLGSGKQTQEFMQMMMAMTAKQSDMQAEAMQRTIATTDAMKDKAQERLMDLMQDRLDKAGDDGDEEKSKSGTADIIREVRLGLASLPALAAAVKPAAAPAAVAPPVQEQPAAVKVPLIPMRLPPALIALNVMRQMQTKEIPVERHRSLHGKLAGTVMEDPALAGFIVNDDLGGLIAHITPLIQAPGQEPLAAWAKAPETLGWFENYVRTKLQPLVRMLQESAPPAPPAEPLQGPGAVAGADSTTATGTTP